MKKILLITALLMVLCGPIAEATLTYGPDFYQTNIRSVGKGMGRNDPVYLFIAEADPILSAVDSGTYYSFTPSDAPAIPAEGMLYYDATADQLIFYNGSSTWVTLAESESGTLDEAYNAGNGITVDGSAVTLTVTDAANNAALVIAQNDATNDIDAVQINSAADDAAAVGLQFACTAGFDVQGTSDTWNISIAGVFNGESLTGLTNGQGIVFDTDAEIQFGDASEDVAMAFSSNTVTWATDTGVDSMAFGVVDDLEGVGTIVFDAAACSITVTSDAGAEDLTISQAGSVDASLVLSSAGTGADAIDIETSAGGISIASTGGDTVIDATDKSIKLDCGEAAAADGIVLVTTGADSGIDITSLADIDITTTGAAGEDISLTNTGGSIILTATEAAADAIVLNASTAVGGIDITSNADIDITTTGAAGEDISITNTGGSVIITATENDAGAIQLVTNGGVSEELNLTATQSTAETAIDLNATAGGINLDAAAAKNVDIAGGQVLLSSKDNAASAIALTANVGASETIVVTNTQGTGESAITLASTAGGVNVDAAAAKDLDLAGGQVKLVSKDDAAGAISLTANIGASETITVTNTQGTSAAAIALTSTAGGITATTGGNFVLAVTGNVVGNINGDGSDFIMGYLKPVEVEPSTAETVLITDSGKAFVTTAGQTTVTYTLPDAVAGLVYTFIDNSAGAGDDLVIDCQAGDNIDQDTNGDAIESVTDAVPQTITLMAVNGTDWVTIAKVGTWGAQ